MAFNPFHSMRKNSKAILAVVTIFIMFIFVLGSGLRGGDFFQDVLPNWLGGGRSDHSQVAAKAFDHDIHVNELHAIKGDRELINEFMLMAMDRAHVNQLQEVDAQMQNKRISPDVASQIQKYVQGKLQAVNPPRDFSERERASAGQRYLLTLQQAFDQRFGAVGYQQLHGLLGRTDKKEHEADYNAILAVLNVLAYDFDMLRAERSRQRPFYFNSVANSTLHDALLFKLMLLEADKMGIKFPRDVVNDLVIRETSGFLRSTDSGMILRAIKTQKNNVDADRLVDGLANEFKVRTVVLALMGTQNAPPAYETPYEFYQYFKDNLSEINFNVIRVPVQDFVAKVGAEPAEEELRKLFNAKAPDGQPYKQLEPDPSRDTPGFKEPRRIKLGWIGGDAALPVYARNLPVVAAVSTVAAGLAPGTGGGAVPSAFHVAQPALAEGLPLAEKYQAKVKSQRELYEESGWFRNWLSDSSIYNPLPIAALAAQFAGPLQPLSDLTARAAVLHQAVAVETRNRVRFGFPAVLAAAGGPLDFPLLGIAPGAAAVPALVPMAAYAGMFRDELRDQRLTHFFTSDMQVFQEQMRKFRTDKAADAKEKKTEEAKKDGKPDLAKKDRKPEELKAEAEKFVADFAKVRGMTTGASKDLHDKFTIADDPGLKPLAEKAPVKPGDRPGGEWASTFFSEAQFIPEFNFTMPARDVPLYDPVWFPGMASPRSDTPKEVSYMAWKTEEVLPKSYQSYDAAPAGVKERVKAAWKWEKARDLAKAEADRLAEKAREVAKKQLQEANNINGFRGELFDVSKTFTSFDLPPLGEPGMSVFRFQHGFQPNQPSGYQPYTLKPSADIPYPGDLTGELLKVRDKPLGETLVVADQPKANFYVASLVRKREKDVEDFTLVYGRTNRTLPGDRDTLYQIAIQDRALPEARQQVIERIKAEGHYVEYEDVMKTLDKPEREE